MRPLTILSLVLLVTLAGCSAVPSGHSAPQEEPAPVMLVNNASQMETFEVGVVEVGSQLQVHRRNKGTYNPTIGQGSSTTENPDTHPYTRIEFPETAWIHGRYTLKPGEQKQLAVENVSPSHAIVVLVYDEEDETYRSIKTLSCGGPILGYKVETMSGGSDDWAMSGHSCGY